MDDAANGKKSEYTNLYWSQGWYRVRNVSLEKTVSACILGEFTRPKYLFDQLLVSGVT
jgi:hypothetical protein